MRRVLAIILFCVSAALRAGDIYVSVDGADGNAGTTTNAPKQHITVGLSSVSAGSALYIRAGDYTSGETWPLTISTAGTSTNYSGLTKVIGCDTNWNPINDTNVLAWAKPPTNINITWLISGTAASNFWIQGVGTDMSLTGAGGSGAGWRVEHGAHHITWTNFVVKNTPSAHGMLITPSPDPPINAHHVTFTHGLIDKAGYEHAIWDPSGSDDHALYLEADDFVVDHMRFSNAHSHGVHCFGEASHRGEIRFSRFDNNGAWQIGLYSGTEFVKIYDKLMVGNGSNVVLRLQRANTNLFANNICYGLASGILVDEQATVGGSTGNEIANNIFTAFTSTATNNSPINVLDGATNTLVRNNLSYSNAYPDEIVTTGSVGTTQSNNKFGDAFNANFVNAPTDLHPQNSGDADGNGFDHSADFTTDYDGITWGAVWDIGAYKVSQIPQGSGAVPGYRGTPGRR